MNEILDSIINGQRIQAIEQLAESTYTFDELLEAIYDSNSFDDYEMVRITRVAIAQGYLVESIKGIA